MTNGASGTAESLDRRVPFTGSDSHDSLNSGYPNFAVADLLGACHIGDGVDTKSTDSSTTSSRRTFGTKSILYSAPR